MKPARAAEEKGAPPGTAGLLGASRGTLGGSTGRARVAVVGGGVSGLVAAYELRKKAPEVDVVLLEATTRFGGNLRTERVGELLLDVGPDSFLRARPEAMALVRELGLEDELVTTRLEARGVYVAHDGALRRMPEGLSLGVPLRLGALLDTELLSPLGKLRALAEPFVPARREGGDESIADFARRRLGRELAERIAMPLLSGIVAGDPERLSIAATFPQLVEHELCHGSLLRGMLGGKSLLRSLPTLLAGAQGASPFVSFSGGIERLVEALVEALPRESLRAGAAVQRVVREGEGFALELRTGERIAAHSVVLSLPPWSAAALLPDAELARELASVRHSSTATVFFAFDERNVERRLDATGFLVPEGEGDILAATWISSKWEGRAPRGTVLVRAFVGGARHPEQVSGDDDVLVAQSARELRRFMGPLGAPLFTRVYRYRQGNPQPELGHLGRLGRVRARLSATPGLFLIGAGYGGVGIPDCVRQAREAVRVLLEG